MLNSDPFLSIDFFYSLANVHLLHNNIESDVHQKIKLFKNNLIIFCVSEHLYSNANFLLSIKEDYVLITASNYDTCVPFMVMPSNNQDLNQKMNQLLEYNYLLKWYTKNPCISHTKLCPFPLGPKWQWTSTWFFGEDKSTHHDLFNRYCYTPEKNFQNFELKKNLLYFNFNVETTNTPNFLYLAGIRSKIFQILTDKGFEWHSSLNYNDYLEFLSTFKFCMSPPGQGIDCHRTWESLMVGTIPIVLSSPLNSLYQNLPILIVEDYNIITNEWLELQYEIIKTQSFNFSILYTPYWYKKVYSHFSFTLCLCDEKSIYFTDVCPGTKKQFIIKNQGKIFTESEMVELMISRSDEFYYHDIDVTNVVWNLPRIIIPLDKNSFFGDPCPGFEKIFKIVYPKSFEKEFQEDQIAIIHVDLKCEYYYGTNIKAINVTSIVVEKLLLNFN